LNALAILLLVVVLQTARIVMSFPAATRVSLTTRRSPFDARHVIFLTASAKSFRVNFGKKDVMKPAAATGMQWQQDAHAMPRGFTRFYGALLGSLWYMAQIFE
jgi:hypothetical protein